MVESAAQKAKFDRTFPIHPQHKKYEPGDNHAHRHFVHVPPAYLIEAGMTYTGVPFKNAEKQ
jgi:hypothetical protein